VTAQLSSGGNSPASNAWLKNQIAALNLIARGLDRDNGSWSAGCQGLQADSTFLLVLQNA
jgi:hypothetical protein